LKLMHSISASDTKKLFLMLRNKEEQDISQSFCIKLEKYTRGGSKACLNQTTRIPYKGKKVHYLNR
jgi:hypothetical protein